MYCLGLVNSTKIVVAVFDTMSQVEQYIANHPNVINVIYLDIEGIFRNDADGDTYVVAPIPYNPI